MDGLEQELTGLDLPHQNDAFQDRTIGQLARQIRSADVHVGGGSAAAATTTLAAATAELVVSLTFKRRTTGEFVDTIQRDLQRLNDVRSLLPAAGDRDELALDSLMQAYRERGTDRNDRFVEAAESSLAIAELASEVIEIAARQVPLASRFTASDLGAAAALAYGAAVAALLTARINVNLLDSSQKQMETVELQLRSRVDSAADRAAELAGRAHAATEQRIEGQR